MQNDGCSIKDRWIRSRKNSKEIRQDCLIEFSKSEPSTVESMLAEQG